MTKPRLADAVNGDAGIAGDRVRQCGPGISDQIDGRVVSGEGAGVVLHPGTSPEIPDDNDGSSHH